MKIESLLKIPFGIYKIEPILNISKETIKDFCILVSKIRENYKSNLGITLKAIIAKPGSGIKVVKN